MRIVIAYLVANQVSCQGKMSHNDSSTLHRKPLSSEVDKKRANLATIPHYKSSVLQVTALQVTAPTSSHPLLSTIQQFKLLASKSQLPGSAEELH